MCVRVPWCQAPGRSAITHIMDLQILVLAAVSYLPACRHAGDNRVYVQSGKDAWTEAPRGSVRWSRATATRTGAWILPAKYAYNFDRGLTKFLQTLWRGESVIEVGAGLGCYTAALQASGALRSVVAYDGAKNVQELTGGLVKSNDLTERHAIKEVAGWVFCMEGPGFRPAVGGSRIRYWETTGRLLGDYWKTIGRLLGVLGDYWATKFGSVKPFTPP